MTKQFHKPNTYNLALICCFVLFSTTLQWHELGHYTVANIAQIHLQETSSGKAALTWALSQLVPFSEFCGEGQYPFTEAATWADRIKTQGWATMFKWHFINQVTVDQNYVVKQRIKDLNKDNIIRDIKCIVQHLGSSDKDLAGSSKSILGKSMGLRNLIHFLGDIHQPLHVTSRYSKKNPSGDLGGNLFLIPIYGNKGP